MFVISRFVNGITLNPKEYILESEDGEVAKFATDHDAVSFLLANGVEFNSLDELWVFYGMQIESEGQSQCN